MIWKMCFASRHSNTQQIHSQRGQAAQQMDADYGCGVFVFCLRVEGGFCRGVFGGFESRQIGAFLSRLAGA